MNIIFLSCFAFICALFAVKKVASTCMSSSSTSRACQRILASPSSQPVSVLQSTDDYMTKNASDIHKVTLTRNETFVDLLHHPCRKSYALYLSNMLYLTKDNFQSVVFPLQVDGNSLEGPDTRVMSAVFLSNSLILLIKDDIYSYDLSSEIITKSSGITDQVTSLSTYLQCEESADWCNTQNKIVLAYSTESPTLSFYMSQDEGLTFIRKTLDYPNQVKIHGMTVVNSYQVVSALVKNDTENKAVFVSALRNQSSSESSLPFHVSADHRLAFTQFASHFGTFLIWDSTHMYYSANAGQTVLPIYLNSVLLKNNSQYLETDEMFRMVVTDQNGDFAALTNKNRLFFGREGFRAEAVEVYNLPTVVDDNSVLDLSGIADLSLLTASSATDRLIMKRNKVDIQYLLNKISPALPMCQYQTLESNITDTKFYYMDQNKELVFETKLVPEAWQDQKLIVSFSDPNLIEARSRIIKEEINVKGVHTKYMETRLKQKTFSHISRDRPTGIANIKVGLVERNIACKKNPQLVAHIGVGCPPGKHIRVRKNASECTERNHNYTIPAKMYDPSYLRGVFGIHDSGSKTVYYDYNTFRCPVSTYHSDNYKPIIDLYQGDQFVEQVHADYSLYEIHGIFKYSFSKSTSDAGCRRAPQTWLAMLQSQATPDPTTAWHRKNYQSCVNTDGNNSPDIDLSSNSDPYEILNSNSDNSIIWSGYNGIFIFEVLVMDPSYSFCDLRTRFAIRVYGSPPKSELPSLVVSGIIILSVIVCLVISYGTLLKSKRIQNNKKQEVAMLQKLDLSEVHAHLDKTET